MKVIILAGGLGTRLSEETETKPKPMVLIDNKPILWHIMNIFASQGDHQFVVALGYKGEVIQEWIRGLDTKGSTMAIHPLAESHLNPAENVLKVTSLETGINTQTGGRIAKCMRAYPGERVIATYGDGLANVSILKLLAFHESHGKLATVTAVRPPARFGHLHLDGNLVTHFGEKKQSDVGWINGGFFVLEPEVVDFIFNENEPFETGALPRLVEQHQLMAYHHDDFWQPMDTLREKNELEALSKDMPPPWMRIVG